MGYLKYVKQAWNKQLAPELKRERLIAWRKEPATVRIEHPTRPDRARSLGYKAKQGFIVVRQRVIRGGRMRPKIQGGRRPKTSRQTLILDINYQLVAEQRAQKKFPNCRVLNSYYALKDGKNYWYEIILVDTSHPVILADKRRRWIVEIQHKGRVSRGLTSAAKKSRGLRNKGTGTEKMRPSKAATYRRKVNRWGMTQKKHGKTTR